MISLSKKGKKNPSSTRGLNWSFELLKLKYEKAKKFILREPS
jgi:hypothetical protein